jgi:hypothetical protein
MSDRDYYEILGLTPAADATMVDQSYWHLARKYQSLATTNPRARDMLDELNEAYGVVGTPKLRHQYDAFRDDVLITKGMIKPVKANAKARERERHREIEAEAGAANEHVAQKQVKGAAKGARRLPAPPRLPAVPGIPVSTVEHWRTYATGGIIVALALAGAWQGVNLGFVIAALGSGLVLALTPTLRRRMSEFELGMPDLRVPQVGMPQVAMPKLGEAHMARLRDLGVGAKDERLDAGEVQASTAAMISRWRNSVGLRPMAAAESGEDQPSMTLVDIVESERDLDETDEPMSAVIDILRGARRPVETD